MQELHRSDNTGLYDFIVTKKQHHVLEYDDMISIQAT